MLCYFIQPREITVININKYLNNVFEQNLQPRFIKIRRLTN